MTDEYVAERDPRIRVRQDVSISRGADTYAGVTADLSPHGASILSRTPFEPGEAVVLGLYLDEGRTRSLVVQGEVIWALEETPAAPGATDEEGDDRRALRRYGIGFRAFRDGDSATFLAFLRDNGVAP